MRFGNIQAAYLLWLVVFLAIFYFWAARIRARALAGLAEAGLLAEIASSVDTERRKLKVFLVVAAVFLIVLSLMRPQWGFSWQEVKKKGFDILIAIDTSKSMLAEDVRPNRLERSKLAVKDFVHNLKGDRVGLIAFSGSAFLQCPLTTDYNGFILMLDDLSVSTIPKGGTSVTDAIVEAIVTYRGQAQEEKILVLMTDGEDHAGNAVKAAERAKKDGIKIYCIGIGTSEGELIPVTDENGRQTFLKDREGNVVKTRLDEETLQKIARMTGASYVRASGAGFGLDALYREKLSGMEKRTFEEKLKKRYKERFQIPLTLAILLLIAELFISERKKQNE